MTRSIAPLLLAVGTLITEAGAAQSAQGEAQETSTRDVEQCVALHESARQLRVQEQWLAARTTMAGCAEARCPLAIASDCRAWLDELTRVLPTLLVVIEREGAAAPGATLSVELDGVPLRLPEPPAPLELLPGPHRLRLTLGSSTPVERVFVLQQGEKNHVEQVRFAPPAERPLLAPPLRPRQPSALPARPVPAATYWLSAGALAAVGASATLLALAVRQHRAAQVTCAPACGHATRSAIETKLVLADVAGGVGIALAGLAVYSYVRRPADTNAAPSSGPTLSASSQGVALSWRGQFQ